ncbi:MAG: hypothetical protein ABS949_07920 [Solibacillus sp.]
MEELEELKAAITNTGETVEAYLTRKYFTGNWRVEGDVYIYAYQVPGLPNATEYRWGSDEQGFYTIRGKTQNLTPQFDRKGIEIAKARGKIDPRKLAIYDRWNELFTENDDVEDVARFVSKEFEMTVDKAVTVYQRIGQFLS